MSRVLYNRSVRGDGFTLIELLVTISIIGILAGLLLPAIGLIRFSAVGTKCTSNKRQVVIGILAYANDFEGHMPWQSMPSDPHTMGAQWNQWGHSCANSMIGQIFPYTGTMAIGRCPADTKSASGGGGADDPQCGGHTPADCPSPETCRGRSDSYFAWNSGIMSATTGCTVAQYKTKVRAKKFSGNYSCYTGQNPTGQRPDTQWTWFSAIGSTLMCDMWYDMHIRGNKCGTALANIEGAARFRTYPINVYQVAPIPQLTRYEEP